MQVTLKRVKEKTDKLEKALLELAEQMKALAYQAMKTERELQEFKEEMRIYREQKEKEIQEFKEEMKKYREQKEREIQAYREEVDKQIKEMNKKWGDLVNKWGTMAEDIIFPGIKYVIERHFPIKVERQILRAERKIEDEVREYDVLVFAGPYLFIHFIKSKFRLEHFKDFEEALKEFPRFFPEFAERYKIVPVIAAFNFDQGVINTATKKGFLALQMSGDYLDFVNADKVKI